MEENKVATDSSAPNPPELTRLSGEQAEERTAREGRISELEAKLAEANAVSYACGMIYGLEKPFIGGCGKPVPQHESYRCTDCTAAYHRECARTHFETDAMITAIRDKANKELIAGWQKAVADAESECSRLASRVEQLEKAWLNVTKHDLNAAIKTIQMGTAKFMWRETLRLTHWEIEMHGKKVHVVYDNKRQMIVTTLTPEMVAENEFPKESETDGVASGVGVSEEPDTV